MKVWLNRVLYTILERIEILYGVLKDTHMKLTMSIDIIIRWVRGSSQTQFFQGQKSAFEQVSKYLNVWYMKRVVMSLLSYLLEITLWRGILMMLLLISWILIWLLLDRLLIWYKCNNNNLVVWYRNMLRLNSSILL